MDYLGSINAEGGPLIVGDASALLCMALAAIILATHRTNIERLLDGTEFNFRGETT